MRTDRSSAPPARFLIGRISEYNELLGLLDEKPGLIVIDADPLSGASALAATCVHEVSYPAVLVDARSCRDALDLAMAIADAAIARLAPEAQAWWNGVGSPIDTAGLRVSRALSHQGVVLDDLRLGAGRGLEQLKTGLALAAELAKQDVLVVIDHLDLLLEDLPADDARRILASLRSARQDLHSLQLTLVGRAAGHTVAALADPTHPLYHAGQALRVSRPRPQRFVDDLAIGRPWTDAPVSLIGAAAELAAGVPSVVWRIVDLDPGQGEAPERAVGGWRRLRELTEVQTARQFDLLRRAHPIAQTVVAAISAGLGPYELPANDNSVRAALSRMRSLGVVWAPRPRSWAVADPVLQAWARAHAPSWVRRRADSSQPT